MLNQSDNDFILYMAGCSLAKTKEKDNWVDDTGGLPEYLCRIARAIMRGDKSKSTSTAIAIAVGRAKVWARGGGGVTAKTSAKAAKAVAEWESKKKAAKADNKIKASYSDEIMLVLANSFNVDEVRRQYQAKYPYREEGESRWIREMWSDHLIAMIEGNGLNQSKFVKVNYKVTKDGVEFGEEIEVKESFVPLSHPDLQTSLTDAQLEKATLIPCTQKDNMSLVEAVALSHKLRQEAEFIKVHNNNPHVLALAVQQMKGSIK